jgi:hypothetical protein
MSDCDISCP